MFCIQYLFRQGCPSTGIPVAVATDGRTANETNRGATAYVPSSNLFGVLSVVGWFIRVAPTWSTGHP
jgi:hypothetical protein